MRKGFTLIEMIVTVVLTGLLALVIAVYIREGFDAWNFLSGQKNLALATRASLTRITRELKRCSQNTNITVHTSTEVRFVDVEANDVRFYQNGTDLMRNADILLQNLQSPDGLAFSYFDSHGVATTTAANIRLVRCRLTGVKGANRFVMESAAAIRVRRVN